MSKRRIKKLKMKEEYFTTKAHKGTQRGGEIFPSFPAFARLFAWLSVWR
jgi:hypothetical protein